MGQANVILNGKYWDFPILLEAALLILFHGHYCLCSMI